MLATKHTIQLSVDPLDLFGWHPHGPTQSQKLGTDIVVFATRPPNIQRTNVNQPRKLKLQLR